MRHGHPSLYQPPPNPQLLTVYCYFFFTTSTGQVAWPMTRSATEPIRSRFKPVRPWLPRTMRSGLLGLGRLDDGLVGLAPEHHGFHGHALRRPPTSNLAVTSMAVLISPSAAATAHPDQGAAHPLGDAEGFPAGRGAEGRIVAGHEEAPKTQGDSLGHHQDVHRAVADDPGGDAAHEKAGQAGEPVAAHDDPVGRQFFGFLHYALVGRGTGAEAGLQIHPLLRRLGLPGIQAVPAPRPPGAAWTSRLMTGGGSRSGDCSS